MRWVVRALGPVGALLALAGGCGDESSGGAGGSASATTSAATGTGAGGDASTSTSATTSASSTSSAGGGGATGEDPDCAVLTVLQAKCWSCHATTEHGDSDLTLVTYDDLTAPSVADGTVTNAELAVALMQAAMDPMPPTGDVPATAADIAAFESWIAAGYPKADCGTLADDPYEVDASCPSNTFWSEYRAAAETMHPGKECNACHNDDNAATGGDAPIFAVAGTVFGSAHSPDDCLSPESEGAEVEIVDANGTVYLAPVGPTGNFMIDDPGLTYPYVARVVFQGRERWMTTAQDEADCNKCHTQSGDDLVPGRIILP